VETWFEFPITLIFQVGVLNVVEAPDILYNETSNDTIVAEGASVQLRCEARGYPEPTVTWRREDGTPIVLRNRGQPNRGIHTTTIDIQQYSE
jgi:hypothetical protein